MLQLEDEVRGLHARVDRLEREMRQAIDETHRTYRRDLVPLSQSVELVPLRIRRRSTPPQPGTTI